MTQLDRILDCARSNIGSSYWHGYCQAFVAYCYEYGMGKMIYCSSANEARRLYMKPGTYRDLAPPAGSAVYFNGDGEKGRQYGHTAISAGNGKIYDPVAEITLLPLTATMHNGYLGWGWFGGKKPNGAVDPMEIYSSFSSVTASELEAGKKPVTYSSPISVSVKSVSGSAGERVGDLLRNFPVQNGVSLLMQNGEDILSPVPVGEITLTSCRKTSAAVLKFTVLADSALTAECGCPVALRYNGHPMFYGYVFEMEQKNSECVSFTCYDQLRYLQNKDSFVYSLSYTELVRLIAGKYRMKTGVLENTEYVIPSRMEEGTLFDILATAADLTCIKNGGYYVLYDDFGSVTLKKTGNMKTDVYLDSSCVGLFYEKNSIDREVYNRVILARDNALTGQRELYVANDSRNQSLWGVLQLYQKADKDGTAEQIKKYAQDLLKQYNAQSRRVSAVACTGSAAVRGGSMVCVALPGKQAQYMICESCRHHFVKNDHTMDLELSGGTL